MGNNRKEEGCSNDTEYLQYVINFIRVYFFNN